MIFSKSNIVFSFFVFTSLFAIGQQKKLTIDDAVLKQRTTLAPERLMQLQWIPKTEVFSYVIKVNGKEKVFQINANSLKADTVFGIDEFQKSFRTLEMDGELPQRMPFITWVNLDLFRFYYNNAFYTINIKTNQASLITKVPKIAEDLEFDPNTKKVAFTVNSNVLVYDTSTWLKNYQVQNIAGSDASISDKTTMITTDGSYGLVNGKTVHRSEFGITKGLFWSGNGNKLAYYKMYESGVTDYELMNFDSKPGGFEKIKYPMAGSQSHLVKLFVQDFGKQRQFEVQTKASPDQYLTNVAWSPDESLIYIAIVNRDQNELKLNQYDGRSGVFIKTCFEEKDAKYVEPEHPVVFVKNDPGKFIWMSKRDGYNQLYLYTEGGKLLSQLTKDKFDVTEFLGFDATGKMGYYLAATNNGMDRQCYSIDLTTGKNKLLTINPGNHAISVSESGNFLLDTYSNLETPKRSLLLNKAGSELAVLLQAKNPLADYKTNKISLGTQDATDGKTKLNYRLIFPSDYDSTKKYPVLVYLYGGPHAQMVTNSWLAGADLWLYYMAQEGYIVFTIDNRGSSNRGKEFEQATFRKFGQVEREDQLAGLRMLKQIRGVDTNRIGIFGWSFGGFMSISMMTRTNEFKVGVAGGPVTDWSLYEIMYTERYMDKPQENKEGYEDSNLINYVKSLNGKLMLIHGTDDDVVIWQHSLNYIKKCVDEGVQVDYFVYPEHKHNVLGKDRVHLMKKVTAYFNQNL